MLDRLLSSIAPHHCIRCGVVADGLCASCKKGVQIVRLAECVQCGYALQDNCCQVCTLAGVRQDIPFVYRAEVRKLLQEYKFSYRRAYARVLADLLHSSSMPLADHSLLIPLPTAPAHIRKRGFDHTRQIVRHLAKLQNRPYDTLLVRTKNFRQVGADRSRRAMQAADAYYCPTSLSPHRTYILVDDVVTTGASMAAGVLALRQAGAVHITLLAIAYQPLE